MEAGALVEAGALLEAVVLWEPGVCGSRGLVEAGMLERSGNSRLRTVLC